MRKILTIAVNIALAVLISVGASGGFPPVVLHFLVGFAIGASLLSAIALLPISSYWAMLIDMGFKDALKNRTDRLGKDAALEYVMSICQVYEGTGKLILSYKNTPLYFYTSLASSLAVSAAIVVSAGWVVVGAIVLILDCVAYGCVRWLMNNAQKVTAVALEAVNEAYRINPELKENE